MSMPTPPSFSGPSPYASASGGATPKPKTPNSNEEGIGLYLIYAALGLFLLGLIGVFVSYRTGRVPENIPAPAYSRDMLTPATRPVATQVFTTEVTNRLFAGDGIEIPFQVTFNGGEEWKSLITVPKERMGFWSQRPKRQRFVREQIKRFSESAQQWADYRGQLVYELYFDNTNGVDESLAKLVRGQVENLGIRNALRMGHGIELYSFKLSNEFRINDEPKLIIPIGAGEAAYSQVEAKLSSFLTKSGTKSATSLASGLFNAMAKNQGVKNRTMLVITDGIENSDLGDFYKKPPQKSQYNSLWEKIQAKKPCPDLHGTRLYWKGFKSDATEDEINQSLKFWEFGFGRCGAGIAQMEY